MDSKSKHSMEQTTPNSTEESDKEIEKLETSHDSITNTSATVNEEFATHTSFQDLHKSDTAVVTSNTHSNKDANKTLSCQLSKSETDCLNLLNDTIASASGKKIERNGNNSEECLVERVCYESMSNSTVSREEVNSEISYKSQPTTIQSSGNSLETTQTDDGIDKMSTDNVESNIEADTVDDLNMSDVHDRMEATFDECLYKVNDACGIKACSQHEMNATININLNENKSRSETETETKTETTNNVDNVTVSQDHIVVEHDDSVNDMKAIVCQVLRTWAERQSANTRNRHPRAAASQGIEKTQNVTNVREYVKKIEGSFTQPSIKDNSINKNELYTNIVQKVLTEDGSEQEVREETLQLMNETDNEEQWKQKFHEILHMFQELANKMKISQPKNNDQRKCFNYLKGPTEDLNENNHKEEEEEEEESMYMKSMESDCNTRNVAEQTELPTQVSFCCQVSQFAFTLENEVQTDGSVSKPTTTTTTAEEEVEEEDGSDTLIQLPNSMSEDSIPFRDLNTEGSGLSLTKVSGSQMELLSATSYRSAPCESNFHTIHIEAGSSPAASVLQRQPLCTRFWKVVRECWMGTCFCIQVNKDCIFCIAFIAIFLICSSILTSFFYRTLHADSTMLHHPLIHLPTVQSAAMKITAVN